ncbi:potassium channel protein [Opitutaceae bacterium TAV4]|nr:potassium channel protein [Opitutaceae bacterium TAV4]RRK02518.1 potassium channel protein [Opitutaceae bacterium TAV3]
MKFLPATITEIVRQTQPRQRNVRLLLKFIAVLALMVLGFSVIFHFIMAHEGRDFHMLDGVYWTFTVMTTLGFGDITFNSVLGRMFSVTVMLSGLVFLLMLLPFTFIEFFYAPWMAAQAAAKTPKRAPENLSGHVIFTSYDPVTAALIPRLEKYQRPYLVLVPDQEAATRLHELGVKVMLGTPDEPATWTNARARHAALVLATGGDVANTNATFTVRQEAPDVPIIATAKDLPSCEILPMAGATHILRLDELLGSFLARCVESSAPRAHVVAEFGPLLIAEATASDAGLSGQKIRDCGLRARTGLMIIGCWSRGTFLPGSPDLLIQRDMMILLAGSRDQFQTFDRIQKGNTRPPAPPPAPPAAPASEPASVTTPPSSAAPVIIVGAGRVGRATARTLDRLGINSKLIERLPTRIPDSGFDPERVVIGDAADMAVMRRAGMLRARTVVITSHDDDANIYLTVFCRRIRPDLQIIVRATHERNVATLHRAGADFVMAYTTIAVGTVCNFLTGGDLTMVAEGVHAFRVKTPKALHGKRLAESRLRESTGCFVVALQDGESTRITPGPDTLLEPHHELILVGGVSDEERFLTAFPGSRIGSRGSAAMG